MRIGFFVFTMAIAASTSLMAAKPTREQALYDEMNALVKSYQLAQLQFDGGDSSKLMAMNKAIEDLEDIANQCFKLKSCSKTQVISAYEQLIKRRDMPASSRVIDANSLPALGTTVKLLGPRQFELLVQYNEPMQAAIANWLTVNRSFFLDSWENYQYMRYLMAPEYDRAGLPEALLFGMMTKESGGKVHSTSRAGASGPLQFMPATAKRFGIGMGEGYDMRFDPQFAARANGEYMNERFAELNKSLEMAIAGYNGGEGRARRIYGQHGGDFWQERVYKEWPAETRDYVPAVLAAAWLFLHPEEYGLTLPKLDYTPSTLALQRASSINELTICLGNPHNQFGWFRVLRNLNPHYEPGQYISQGTQLRAPKKLVESYQARCVNGPQAEMARTLVQARKAPVFAAPIVEPVPSVTFENSAPTNPDALATGNTNGTDDSTKHHGMYIVQRGETLMMIMRRYDCNLRRLINENNLSPPHYVIRPGQEIKLMGCKK